MSSPSQLGTVLTGKRMVPSVSRHGLTPMPPNAHHVSVRYRIGGMGAPVMRGSIGKAHCCGCLEFGLGQTNGTTVLDGNDEGSHAVIRAVGAGEQQRHRLDGHSSRHLGRGAAVKRQCPDCLCVRLDRDAGLIEEDGARVRAAGIGSARDEEDVDGLAGLEALAGSELIDAERNPLVADQRGGGEPIDADRTLDRIYQAVLQSLGITAPGERLKDVADGLVDPQLERDVFRIAAAHRRAYFATQQRQGRAEEGLIDELKILDAHRFDMRKTGFEIDVGAPTVPS